jgi:eukaryotic-like serine/threonine-protein kinase
VPPRRDQGLWARPSELPLLPRRLGRYTLFDHIGRGGMADIFLAQACTDFDGQRLVVIKEVLPALAGSLEFSDMLVREAKLAARLCHANVAQVEDLGRDGAALFIAMEYVEGLDLREMLRRCAKQHVALPVEFSLWIVGEVLAGLSYAHRARDDRGAPLGLVHRDVSPSNVLLSFEGEVKLCDFGIARAAPLAAALPEDAIAGKAGYMSPEQASGEALDARSDVFAVGVVLWEMLAGRRLYKAGPGELLLSVARRAEIPNLPARDLPHEGALRGILTRALAKDRDDRYESAAEMQRDLEEYAARAGLRADPLRLGAFLKDNFAAEVLSTRRARAVVLRALARGPAAIIEPIFEARGDQRALLAGDAGPLSGEGEVTPSAFLVTATARGPILPAPLRGADAPVLAPDLETDFAPDLQTGARVSRFALLPPSPPTLLARFLALPEVMASALALALAAAVFVVLWYLARA